MLTLPILSCEDEPWLSIFCRFALGNQPFVLPAKYTDGWLSRRMWMNSDGKPNIKYFKEKFGSCIVPVSVEGKYESEDDTMDNYIDYMMKNNECSSDEPKRYLKDWHYQLEFGTDDYDPPMFLHSDWVNREEWTTMKDNPFKGDYRFVYIGVQGSWTILHSDVMSSHSWSANICGCKEWFFIPPGKEIAFMDDGNLITDMRERRDIWDEVGVIHLIQNAGEIVFVPSNWHHQVHNLEDTISINHNFINSSNINLVYEFLKRREQDVRNEIGHLDMFTKEEFEDQVQLVLGADARLNMPRLRHLLHLIIDSRSSDPSDFPFYLPVCYICSIHSDIRLCSSSDTCLQRISSICKCTNELCSQCRQFIASYDLSIALRILQDIDEDSLVV